MNKRKKFNSYPEIYGIIGYPLKHTLSPSIHQEAFDYLGLNCVYRPFPVRETNLPTLLAGIKILGIKGVNVTAPYKEKVLPYLDQLSPSAASIGAVNTILQKKRKLIGYNTDTQGFLKTIVEVIPTKVLGGKVLVLGAGGSARAVIYALQSLSPEGVIIFNRTLAKAKILQQWAENFVSFPLEVYPMEANLLKEKLKEISFLVNATPVGMTKGKEMCLVEEEDLHSSMVVLDLIYCPKETLLLKRAKRKGILAFNGLGVLLNQAVESFEIWTEKKAPFQIMENVLNRYIMC